MGNSTERSYSNMKSSLTEAGFLIAASHRPFLQQTVIFFNINPNIIAEKRRSTISFG